MVRAPFTVTSSRVTLFSVSCAAAVNEQTAVIIKRNLFIPCIFAAKVQRDSFIFEKNV
jgi:hypothetical protein